MFTFNYKYAIDLVFAILIYFLVVYKSWKSRGNKVLITNTLMYIYIIGVLYVTLMPIITEIPYMFNHPIGTINFEPFIDVTLGRGDYKRQIALNIIMMMPFGIIYPLCRNAARKKENIFYCIGFAVLTSLAIELLQLFSSNRSTDITDLICNTFGALIGYMFYLASKPITDKWLKVPGKKKKRKKKK